MAQFSRPRMRRLPRCQSLATLFEKADAVLHKYVNPSVAKKSEEQEKCWDSEDKDYIRPIKRHKERPPTSYSCGEIGTHEELSTSDSNPNLLHNRFGKQSIQQPLQEQDKTIEKALIQVLHDSKKSVGSNEGESDVSTNNESELLHRFGQQSIHHDKNKTLAKALIQVFHDSKSGPDVQPPRNDRRTLKLSKSDEQGYGFWLQTYDFGKANSVKKKRTFVRYVEDEGPAYLAGLRAGDVIIEVNGQNVEDIEHMKIVGLISETAKQLMLVVKFMDMVRRVELAIRLKNRQAKLKLKLEELEKLKEEEKKILNTTDDCECSKEGTAEPSRLSTLSTLSAYSSTYSSSLEVDLDRLSLNSSSESGIGSLSSISDEITVRTSKFEKRSSRVLDSIKELNCACSIPNPPGLIAGRSGFNSQHSNSDRKFINMCSDNFRTSGKRTVKRSESMPVQKRNSLQMTDLTLELFEYPKRRERESERGGEKMLSNDDMLYDKRHSDGDMYLNHSKRHDSGDMTCGKRMSVDDMLYDKTLCDSDMLYKRLSATETSASDTCSSGDCVTLRDDRYTTNLQLSSSVS